MYLNTLITVQVNAFSTERYKQGITDMRKEFKKFIEFAV